jgi:hypothetical protein
MKKMKIYTCFLVVPLFIGLASCYENGSNSDNPGGTPEQYDPSVPRGSGTRNISPDQDTTSNPTQQDNNANNQNNNSNTGNNQNRNTPNNSQNTNTNRTP